MLMNCRRHRDLRVERRPGWLSVSPLSVLSLAAAGLYRVCLTQDAPFWLSGWNEENGRYWRRCRGTIAGKRNMVTICQILLWPLYSLSVPDCADGIYWFQSGCKSCKSACASVSVCVCVCVEHLKRCKTSTLIDGIAFSYQVLCHYNEAVSNILPGVYPISFSSAGGVTVDFLVTPTKLWKSTGWKFGRKLLYLQCRSWAHSSRSWGTRHI